MREKQIISPKELQERLERICGKENIRKALESYAEDIIKELNEI
jgi:hypothetical protein